MSSPLGFVVLARRPNPPHGYGYEPVSAVFPECPNGLEQAQNVLESCQKRESSAMNAMKYGWLPEDLQPDPVEFVIGEISERSGR